MARKRVWKKCWHEKLLSSPRFRALKPYDRGVYFTLFLLADDDGFLQSGKVVLGVDTLAEELGVGRSKPALRKCLARLQESGLLERREAHPDVLGDGGGWVYVVANSDLLQ